MSAENGLLPRQPAEAPSVGKVRPRLRGGDVRARAAIEHVDHVPGTIARYDAVTLRTAATRVLNNEISGDLHPPPDVVIDYVVAFHTVAIPEDMDAGTVRHGRPRAVCARGIV